MNNIMIRKIIFLLCSVVILFACGQNRFERVEHTAVPRYDIVYSKDKCAVFDNQADSLVTPLQYGALEFLKRDTEDSICIVVFSCYKDGKDGMLAVIETNNETMEILFPTTYMI